MRGKKEGKELAARLESKTGVQSSAKPLTLAEGIERAVDPNRGIFPVETKQALLTRRLTKRAAEILGDHLTWAELTPGTLQYLIRTLARESENGGGARSAEYTCIGLYTIAGWLRQEQLIPESAALPKRGWKTKLKDEWRALTGRRVEPERPRHSVEEVSRIFAALPQGDPRLRLLIELAAELRVGQAVRAQRSDLILEAVGGYGLGRFVVHGAGKKHGEIVDLHPELRTLVDEILTTCYLADAEAAYQRGEIGEYYLFRGQAPEKQGSDRSLPGQTVNPKALREMFYRVKKLAGVEHQPGRAFYGLRRQATYLAPEFAQDARVVNRLSGHTESTTPERIYQDPRNERVRARAAEARREMRRHLQVLTGAAHGEVAGDASGTTTPLDFSEAEAAESPNLSQKLSHPAKQQKALAAQRSQGFDFQQLPR